MIKEQRMLTLPIKKKWFDMILSGDKKEEYREIKPYYTTRFYKPEFTGSFNVLFRNGYSGQARFLEAACSLDIGEGRPEWGAEPGVRYYRLHILEITAVHNIPISVDTDDFGLIAVDALKYCCGRRTYMPSLTREIIEPFLQQIPYKDILAMKAICDYQKEHRGAYGDDRIDKPDWLLWEKKIDREITRRAVFEDKDKGKPKTLQVNEDNRDFGMLVLSCIRINAGSCDSEHVKTVIDTCLKYLDKLHKTNIYCCYQDLGYFDSFELSGKFYSKKDKRKAGYDKVEKYFRKKWYPAVIEEYGKRYNDVR